MRARPRRLCVCVLLPSLVCVGARAHSAFTCECVRRRYAQQHDGCIVSNDKYRDWVAKLPPQARGVGQKWVREHVITFCFVGAEFMPNPDFHTPLLLSEGAKRVLGLVVPAAAAPAAAPAADAGAPPLPPAVLSPTAAATATAAAAYGGGGSATGESGGSGDDDDAPEAAAAAAADAGYGDDDVPEGLSDDGDGGGSAGGASDLGDALPGLRLYAPAAPGARGGSAPQGLGALFGGPALGDVLHGAAVARAPAAAAAAPARRRAPPPPGFGGSGHDDEDGFDEATAAATVARLTGDGE